MKMQIHSFKLMLHDKFCTLYLLLCKYKYLCNLHTILCAHCYTVGPRLVMSTKRLRKPRIRQKHIKARFQKRFGSTFFRGRHRSYIFGVTSLKMTSLLYSKVNLSLSNLSHQKYRTNVKALIYCSFEWTFLPNFW